MNTTTRNWVNKHHDRQRDYAAALNESAHNGSTEARELLPHVICAANALHSLTLCEYAMFPEVRFAGQQAAKFGKRADAAEQGSTIHLYNALIASIFTEAAPRMGDIGEPLHVEEGEEEDAPLYVPEVVPARPEPVPA